MPKDNYGCFECDKTVCPNYGHDDFPYPFCEMRPPEDFHLKKEQNAFSEECHTCAHRLTPATSRMFPCNRCIHKINAIGE